MTIDLETSTTAVVDLSRPVLTAEQAFALLGIDRKTGYRAIQTGSFPVPVVRVGRVIRVPTAPLARLLTDGALPATYDTGTSSEPEHPEDAARLPALRTSSRHRR